MSVPIGSTPVASCGAGLSHWQVPATDTLPSCPAIVLYPSTIATGTANIGPYTFAATLDAPVAPGRHPLCVISHGGGGSHLLYRSIASHLAERGWVVVCPEHPFDNRNDRSRVNTDEAARDRPRHLVHTIDALLEHDAWGTHVDASRIGMAGHSMGGFAALALAGGQPWSMQRVPLDTVADARIGAAVLLAPAIEWFSTPGALDSVRIPLLTMVGEHDPVTPAERVQHVLRALPPTVPSTIEVVPGAGHFAFITPFPAEMRRPDFPPSVDPPGFDREAFHERLPSRIAQFLDETVLSSR
jgi:predicted dienelactone hydrolase